MELVYYPDERLRKVAERVDSFNDKLTNFVLDMIDFMHARKGIGLAAPQVGVSIRVVVACPTATAGEEYVLVNPEVAGFTRMEPGEEGCLSIPGVYAPVTRSARAFVRAQNYSGERVEFEAEGLLARVIQHEVDHLNGVLFTDRLTPEALAEIESRLRELERNHESGRNR